MSNDAVMQDQFVPFIPPMNSTASPFVDNSFYYAQRPDLWTNGFPENPQDFERK